MIKLTDPKTVTYVTFLSPGAFFAEQTSQAVPDRDPDHAAAMAPSYSYAFTFHDVVSCVAVLPDGDEVILSSSAREKSACYYIGGTLMTVPDVERLNDDGGDYDILLSNMRSNGWLTVVRCRTGNFAPFEKGDRMVIQ